MDALWRKTISISRPTIRNHVLLSIQRSQHCTVLLCSRTNVCWQRKNSHRLLCFSSLAEGDGQRKTAKTIVLTGGGGFIGSHMAAALLARGDHVVIIDELNDHSYDSRKKIANLQLLEAEAKQSPGGSLTLPPPTDIGDLDAVRSAFARAPGGNVDAVCHLAARAGVRASLARPDLYVRTNVGGTTNLLNVAACAGCANFVYASSSSVYGTKWATKGATGEGGQRGEEGMAVFREGDEDGHPLSPYAATKMSAEIMAGVYHRLYGLPTTGLRFFTVYGPRGRPDMAPYIFVDRISRGLPIQRFGDGSSWRDYTFVDDVVAAVLAAIDKPHACEVFNIAAGSPVRLSDFIREVEIAVEREAVIEEKPEQKGDIGGTFADISKARAMLNYNPQVSLRDGLKRTVAWYRETHNTRITS